MKTNVKMKTSLEAVSAALNEADMLLDFDIEVRANKSILRVETNDRVVEYSCVNHKQMVLFLTELKGAVPNHIEDIEELLMECVAQ